MSDWRATWRTCGNDRCGRQFLAYHKHNVYCCNDCRNAAHQRRYYHALTPEQRKAYNRKAYARDLKRTGRQPKEDQR